MERVPARLNECIKKGESENGDVRISMVGQSTDSHSSFSWADPRKIKIYKNYKKTKTKEEQNSTC